MNKYRVKYELAIYAETPGDAVVEARKAIGLATARWNKNGAREAINASFTPEDGTAAMTGEAHGDKPGWSCLMVVEDYDR